MTATQPYRGRHWAPDEDETRDAATADTAASTTPDAAPDEGPQPVLVPAATDSDQDGGDTAPVPAEVKDAPAPRKRKLFAIRGGKPR